MERRLAGNEYTAPADLDCPLTSPNSVNLDGADLDTLDDIACLGKPFNVEVGQHLADYLRCW